MSEPQNFWQRFLARPNDDRAKTIGIAVIVAFVCAVVVATTSVMLKPLQDAHLEAERAARMEAMLDTLPGMRAVMEEAGVTALDVRMVDLAEGWFTDEIEPAGYDAIGAASNPETSIAIPAEADVAGIGRRETHAPVYLLQRDGELMLLVLPMRAAGYQSTITAMLALEPDLRTVAALTVTGHGETPGIGARIADPAFAARWPGKQVADDTGEIVIEVVRAQATGPYEVDAVSGATRSSNAIGSMLTFWLGDLGYGPFLDRLEQEGL
ncbi:NADH:ubiquinone reductase (Na(+)-transporting) subunit C [uncultured Sulfitobacter sp.]|uniref:NADH:ubiquinone reductase (Na(+)-transporting) subunit C n=1 Tax=uncultured Sulfitobacter sp. TaxID=191468 RepID=UPI0026244DA3|nr:NADH:ubiquinone reductase (Na(+)-transporting) subunit C [uncultured Sulfitobacter sp.]